MSWGWGWGKTFLFKKILNYLAWQLHDVNILSPMDVTDVLLSSNRSIENFILLFIQSYIRSHM